MSIFINIYVIRLFILQLPSSILLSRKLLVHYRGAVCFSAYYPKARKKNCIFSKLLQLCWSRSSRNIREIEFFGFFVLHFYLNHQTPARPIYGFSQESKTLSDINKKKKRKVKLTLPGLFSVRVAR